MSETVSWTHKMRLAVGFAAERHSGQVDKAGAPYILHPLAVALSVIDEGESVFIAAVCHDLIEDTATTWNELFDMFGAAVAEAVFIVSRKKSENYAEFIKRIHNYGGIAVTVKIADLRHNLSPERTASLPEKMRSIKGRYEKALTVLTA